MSGSISTADLCDEHGDDAVVVQAPWHSYGRHRSFSGLVRTVEAFEDNSLVREALETAGEGAVLVVDGGGSDRCALVGDQLAVLAFENGWAGIVVYGCIRDSAIIDTLPFGIKALGTSPRRSVKRGTGTAGGELIVAGVEVRPGDVLVTDTDGVILLRSPAGE